MGQPVAVHVGADILESPRYAAWARPLSCRDAVRRVARLCHAAGVRRQHLLLGQRATLRRVREKIADSIAGGAPDQLVVLSFSGHSERAVPDEHHGGWCLRDGTLRHAETVALLADAAPSAHIVVVADTCYAAAFADVFADVPATIVLLAACASNQTVLNYPVSEFIATLERLTFPDSTPNPACDSYEWLRHELRQNTPEVERPDVRTNRPRALRQRPFHLPSLPSGTYGSEGAAAQ